MSNADAAVTRKQFLEETTKRVVREDPRLALIGALAQSPTNAAHEAQARWYLLEKIKDARWVAVHKKTHPKEFLDLFLETFTGLGIFPGLLAQLKEEMLMASKSRVSRARRFTTQQAIFAGADPALLEVIRIGQATAEAAHRAVKTGLREDAQRSVDIALELAEAMGRVPPEKLEAWLHHMMEIASEQDTAKSDFMQTVRQILASNKAGEES